MTQDAAATSTPGERSHAARDPAWYRDAVIYELHVKSFFDADGDGIGDFKGLTQKLDYLADLGVTALWLLPFYPSPMRDDGYDISTYTAINPAYGTMADFRRFIRAAHKRGLHVITELVINHTSDQHPWFQRARQAKRGTNARNFYVWSDTDQAYRGTRIIFCDSESSNWTWDPVAQQYYWHRFYSHQPDLNFDNPRVVREVKKIMRFWLDKGVDGLRLDAVPYLVEREGTSNENLPETHQILKDLRAEVDRNYQGRMLLAEANMWPEDVRPYFGDGDECHMAFHFPLMPRLYMALAQEDRHPVTDILRQTPALPEGCQWAVFLRNHDELTLEMVTDRERDYLWQVYAQHERARINLGIRRRLAPLLDNDRRRIELLNSLLMSMPGSPVIYYGDELGMGDNIYLGDRDSVRTPMPWSPDRNGGFSRASPQQLFLPPVMDPVFGYSAVNVEAQAENPSSLLNWMRRLVAVRQRHAATFGRGEVTFLYPGNRRILAYLREGADETILCVVNLGRAPQAVELDLRRFKGRVPVELFGHSAFPPIGDLPYLLTVPRHGFYWFRLAEEAEAPAWHETIPDPLPEFVTLVLPQGARSLLGEAGPRRELARQAVPSFLNQQPWFDGAHSAEDARLNALTPIYPDDGADALLLADFSVTVAEESAPARLLLPLAIAWSEAATQVGSPLLPYMLAQVRREAQLGALYDAYASDLLPSRLLDHLAAEAVQTGPDGAQLVPRCSAAGRARGLPSGRWVQRLGVDAHAAALRVGGGVVVKLYRHLQANQAAERDLNWFLTDVAGFPNVAALLGSFELVAADGTRFVAGLVQEFVANQGCAWEVARDELQHLLEDSPGAAAEDWLADLGVGRVLGRAETLGRRVAELHGALACDNQTPEFAPAPVGAPDLAGWVANARRELDAALEALAAAQGRLPGELDAAAARLRAAAPALQSHLAELKDMAVTAHKIRLHGALHLGRLLVVENDFYIYDFAGEADDGGTGRDSPLADIAELWLSLDRVAAAAAGELAQRRTASAGRLLGDAQRWTEAAQADLLAGYRAAAPPALWPGEPAAQRIVDVLVAERAARQVAAALSAGGTGLRGPLASLLRLATGDADGATATRE